MKYLILILFSIIFLSSCQKALEIDYPKLEPKLVVNCLFTPDSLFTLHLSVTTSTYDSSLTFVEDANCSIWNNDKLLDNLIYTENGTYISTIKPETNVEYTLKISHQKYGNIQAKSYCPQKASIDSVYDQINVYPVEGNINMDNLMYSVLYLNFEDKLKMPQYYFVSLKYRNYPPNEGERWTLHYLKSYDAIIKNEQILEYEPKFLVFSSSLFTKQNINLEILFIHNSGTFKKNLKNVKGFNYPHQLFYKFGTISENYYLYLKSLLKHKYNQNNDIFLQIGDPVQMYTNIENGYGIFAGYNYETLLITDTI